MVPEVNEVTKDRLSADEAVTMALSQRSELKQLALGQTGDGRQGKVFRFRAGCRLQNAAHGTDGRLYAVVEQASL